MLKIEEGHFLYPPYVRVEITPGHLPFLWYYEVSYWDPWNTHEGEPAPCWVSDWEKDGSAFGFHRALRKAHAVMEECWDEVLEEQKGKQLSEEIKEEISRGEWV